MTTPTVARKRADLLSLSGASLASAAVGAWLADKLQPLLVPILLVGLLVHAVGMSARHRLDREEAPLPTVWRVLYAACWIAIAVIAASGVWHGMPPVR